MDTSKDYYESVMRNFQTYRRGHILEQFCRDEVVDYRWILKTKVMYTKWFDDNRCMRPVFSKIAARHKISWSQLMFLLTGAVIRTIKIN